jgi:hypothetical protein
VCFGIVPVVYLRQGTPCSSFPQRWLLTEGEFEKTCRLCAGRLFFG